MILLIINNSFILAGAVVKYIADSSCLKLKCCLGALEIEQLEHTNSELKQEADIALDTMASTAHHPPPRDTTQMRARPRKPMAEADIALDTMASTTHHPIPVSRK